MTSRRARKRTRLIDISAPSAMTSVLRSALENATQPPRKAESQDAAAAMLASQTIETTYQNMADDIEIKTEVNDDPMENSDDIMVNNEADANELGAQVFMSQQPLLLQQQQQQLLLPQLQQQPLLQQQQQQLLLQQQQPPLLKQQPLITNTIIPTTAIASDGVAYLLENVACVSNILPAHSEMEKIASAPARNYWKRKSSSTGNCSDATPATVTASSSSSSNNNKSKASTSAVSPPTTNFNCQETDTEEEGFSDINFEDDNELIEDDDEGDRYDPVWQERLPSSRLVFNFAFKRNSTELGLEGRPRTKSPFFYFEKMLGPDFFTLLTKSCNDQARAHYLFNYKKDVDASQYQSISVAEVQRFIALCLQMSVMKLPTLSDYWKKTAHCGFTGFGKLMSQARFQQILDALNFEQLVEPSNEAKPTPASNEQDALVELRSFLNFFNTRMLNIYTSGRRLVLNEPMVFWKGKFNWERDMSPKFRQNAITLHFLMEQSGLILKILPDVESAERRSTCLRNSKTLVIHRIALANELLKESFEKGHTVFTSKYYGSYGLAHELSQHQTYCTGYLDDKRYGNSKQLIMKPLQKNEFAIRYAQSLMMGKWRRDKKCFYFCSTDTLAIYPHETAKNMWRKPSNNTVLSEDRRPKVVKELDWQLKPSVRVQDYMVNYQLGMERKTISWSKQILIYMLNLMVQNAYIFYNMYTTRIRIIDLKINDSHKLETYIDFRQEIIAALLTLSEAASPKQAVVVVEVSPPLLNGEMPAVFTKVEHMLTQIPRSNNKVMKKKCRLCQKGSMLTLTTTCCDTCPGAPGLCETPCFEIWHAQATKSK